MTFIATVIARDGAAIIADSLVTTMHRVIEEHDFTKLLENKTKNSKKQKIELTPREIKNLFQVKPSHTTNYENKLFQYDNHIAITTSGISRINGKRIEEIIEKKRELIEGSKNFKELTLENKVKDYCSYLKIVVVEHIKKFGFISGGNFLFTNYNSKDKKTFVYKIYIQPSSKDDLKKKETPKIIDYSKSNAYEKVVCSGQNRISQKILFGDFPVVWKNIPKIASKVARDFKISKTKISDSYIKKLRNDKSIFDEGVWRNVNITRLRELSLQEAVDLAVLLMNLERDFQKYTESIPTVGGVIKLAVIDSMGFKFINNDLIVPSGV